MPTKINIFPLHPFFISTFPVLALYLHNKEIINIKDIYVSLLVVVLAATVGLLLLRSHIRKAGLLISCFSLFLFSYWDVYEAFIATKATGFFSHHSILLPLYLILFGLTCFSIIRMKAAPVLQINGILNLSSGFIFLWQLIRIIHFQVDHARYSPTAMGNQPLPITHNSRMAAADYPDIIYLILDGYGRQDVLNRYYQFDNASFINFLKQHNFYIAGKSTANYVRTVLSLSSSLNFDYVQNLIGEKESRRMTYHQLIPLIKRARIIQFLQQHNYRIKTFSSGFSPVEIDFNVERQNAPNLISDFSNLVLQKTPYQIVAQNAFLTHAFQCFQQRLGIIIDPYLMHRNLILAPARDLPAIIDKDYPSFVFADMIVGHPPFVFSSTGQFIPPPFRFSLSDGNHFYEKTKARPQDYIKGYKNQLTYINSLLEQTIKKILAKQKRPLVFIIQGDHGPGGHFHEEELTKTRVDERFPNLSAFYFSDRDTSLLYQHITPVNTFRVVLNKYFATGLPLLQDLNYYSPASAIGDFTPVSEQLKPYR